MATSARSKNKTISLDALMCEGSRGTFPNVPDSGVLDVRQSCKETYEQGVLSCKHHDWHNFVKEGDGFLFETKKVNGSDLLPQRYIPVPDASSASLPLRLDDYPVLGIRLLDVFPTATRNREGTRYYIDEPRIRNTYLERPIFQGKKRILFHSGPDALVEGLNRDKDVIDLYPNLAAMGFDASTSPDFSVNEGSCYPAQIVNLNRSLAMAVRSEANGVPSIPNTFAVDDHQRALWSEYVNRRKIGLVSLNSQLQHRRPEDIAVVQRAVLHLLANAKHDLHIILRGFPFTEWALAPLTMYPSRVHFADSAPFFLAQNNYYHFFDRIEGTLTRRNHKARNAAERALMIEAGIAARTQYLDYIFSKPRPAAISTQIGVNLPNLG